MRIYIECPNCEERCRVLVSDDLTSRFDCPSCKRPVFLSLAGEKFEYLFDSGMAFYLDGRFREAIFNLSSALERAMEVFVKYVMIHKLKDLDKYNVYWKIVSSQSERQMGAFSSILLTELGEIPDLLSPKSLKVELRNKVVHKGYIPNQDECLDYARSVYNIIYKAFSMLSENLGSEVANLNLRSTLDRDAKSQEHIEKYFKENGTEDFSTIMLNSTLFLNARIFENPTRHSWAWHQIDWQPAEWRPHLIRTRAKVDGSIEFDERLKILREDILTFYGISKDL